MSGRRYKQEQESWLREHYHAATSFSDMAEEFNAVFGENRTAQALSDKCTKQMGLKGKINLSQYGCKEKEQLPIGTVRKSATGTYIKVAYVGNAHISGYEKPYWLPLQEKIWKDEHGELPAGKMVCFLDNNPENFQLDNLYPIDRKISAILSKNRWWSDNKDLTLAAIRWCELHYAIKEVI